MAGVPDICGGVAEGADLVFKLQQENTGIERQPIGRLGAVADLILDGFPLLKIVWDDGAAAGRDRFGENGGTVALRDVRIDR